jgi:beta-phosphoglucomutase-like phosphatase (HAD superfamily)
VDSPGGSGSVGVAVVDIDGVVADVRHRLHHLRSRPARWDRFFASAGDDPLLEVGSDVVRELAAAYPVVWLSGRPEEQRDLTERWLAAHQLPAGRLLLRPTGDYRPAAQLKLEVVHTLADTVGVAAVLDDDPAVVRALRAAGFPVVLADWVPHERTLADAQERHGKT